MESANLTYHAYHQLLMELGFSLRLGKEAVRVYEHAATGCTLLLRDRPEAEPILSFEWSAHAFQLIHMGVISEAELAGKVAELSLQETP